jgi:hypothetical protein
MPTTTAMSDRSPSSHLSGDALALYVMGALAPEQTRGLEAHVEGCAACAAALAREAAFELALGEVAREASSTQAARVAPIAAGRGARRGGKGRAAGAWVAAVAAVAAAAVLVLAVRPAGGRAGFRAAAEDGAAGAASERASEGPRGALFACADAADGTPCASDAASSATP